MAIPKIDEQNITAAIKYIDEHGVPDKNKSTQYALVTEDGKKYPPKYVIAVANHLANGGDIRRTVVGATVNSMESFGSLPRAARSLSVWKKIIMSA